MTTLKSTLQLALLKQKKRKNVLQKGFTLVELMIVIVIVGILSAVALPNFLNQTGKAKATEAQTKISAALKSAGAEWHGGLTAAKCNDLIPANGNNWEYSSTSCADDNVTYVGENDDDFGANTTGIVTGTLDPSTGVITGVTFSTS
jgi:type IV pilus assembly protein PilA